MYLLYLWRMWWWVSIGYNPHGHLNSSWGKKWRQYSPIGAWLTIALVALVHSEFEWPKCLSHNPPFEKDGSIDQRSSSRRSKKLLPFTSEAWNSIFQVLRILSHSLFLSNSQEDLHRKMGMRSNFFVSLSTIEWRVQFLQLEHSQNLIEFWWPFP